MRLTFGDLFKQTADIDYTSGKKKTKLTLDISEIGSVWLLQNDEFIRDITLSFLPMVIPPMNWKHPAEFGGYFDPAINKTYTLIKGKTRNQIQRLYEKYPEGFRKLVETINALQATPFRINNTIFEAVNWVHNREINLNRKGIPTYNDGYATILGKDKADEFFSIKRQLVRDDKNRMTKESKKHMLDFIKSIVEGSDSMNENALWKEWANLRKAAIKHSRGEKSKRILMENTLTDAGWFNDEDIYFCYNADYRGRIYPLAGQFSPQGSDVSRGMLEFANGVDLDVFEDTDAIRQIAIVCSNNFGNDKVSLDERADWAEDNAFEMMECARDFKKNTWWMKADKPFLFLQSCIEWTKVMDARLGDGQMVSTLPIAFDGSCNGIQHFSALFLDPKGAEAVNLVDSDVPSDVYQQVGDKAFGIADDSKKANHLLVSGIKKLFGRKVAKRSVMTLPYGVSQKSSNKYVVETVDELLRGMTGITGTEAKVIRSTMGKLIWDAIKLVVETPVVGKDYFQAVAKEMAGWENGLLWFTPTGLPVVQALKKKDVKFETLRVTMNGKEVKRTYPKYTSEIDGGEQANAVAPNYVHSFDSAHLQFSITTAAREGMDNFLCIHDSFATDAKSAGRFNQIIRDQFFKMYHGKDWLNKFHNDCQEQLGFPLITDRMVQGDFDISEVLESKYFFS